MKKYSTIVVFVFITIMLFSLSGCGSNDISGSYHLDSAYIDGYDMGELRDGIDMYIEFGEMNENGNGTFTWITDTPNGSTTLYKGVYTIENDGNNDSIVVTPCTNDISELMFNPMILSELIIIPNNNSFSIEFRYTGHSLEFTFC